MKTKYGFDTSEERSQLMSKIKSKDTKAEILLRKALWNNGYRYKKNSSILPGKPDIVLTKYKLAIFIDGEFWHGFNWEEKKKRIKSNSDYWVKKIERNIERDLQNTKALEDLGWRVIRFWELEVKKDLDRCLSIIICAIKS